MKDWPAKNEELLQKIEETFPDAIEEVVDFRGDRTLVIEQKKLKPILLMLRDDMQFNLLEDICADDYLPEFPRFSVDYSLYSIPRNHRIRLRTWVEDPERGPDTAADIWPVATWLEMEVWDLMGIRFKGNQSLRRLFLPEDWQGFPLRKDYPLGYEEVQFSFNWKAIDDRKPYAKD